MVCNQLELRDVEWAKDSHYDVHRIEMDREIHCLEIHCLEIPQRLISTILGCIY